MKIRLLLRFYRCADAVERLIDNRIMRYACSPVLAAQVACERVCSLIEEKAELARLWRRIDGALFSLPVEDRLMLGRYSAEEGFDADEKRRIRRAAVKLKRRLCFIEGFAVGIALAERYRCLYFSGRK